MTSLGFTVAFIYRQAKKSLTESGGTGEAEGDSHEEEQRVNLHSLVRIREDLLDILVERTRDTSSYTRSAVLKTWTYLVVEEALPLTRIGSIAEVALDRLHDRTAAVRKAAVGLMTALLEFNPFSGNLSAGHYKHLRDEIEKRLDARIAVVSVDRATTANKLPADESDEEAGSADEAEGDSEQVDQVDFREDAEVVALSAELGKCISCLELLQSIDNAVPIIEKMLSSKTTSDVVEALRFASRAVTFSIKGSARCLQR